MERLTVGKLEDDLRKFPKYTEIMLSCGCCRNGSSGSPEILKIQDNTDQTYGYIDLHINNTTKADIELSKDREKFYKIEIEKLEKQLEVTKSDLHQYKMKLNAISNISEV